ncbi:Uncharacterized protein AC509_0475 [Pseudomonas amygdali pv. morsprunorum]|uniref:hypothetical protein n=1 Tax=Pseudomonas amygdali TaxID=47877 RepID=UPI0006CC7BA9|nr:hypothetical protein [Pseudomonas amygdali]KPC48223.1 Uncharacterized protein AC509_0475 [Pseudomonas amygdali pv. morsprunorum]
MTQIFTTNITGNVGNIANASSNFSQSSAAVIEPGNWQALEARLLELGLTAGDTDGLKEDVEQARATGSEEDKKKTAGTWIGRLAGKAASGVTGVSIEAAATGIAKAIAAYFGLPG